MRSPGVAPGTPDKWQCASQIMIAGMYRDRSWKVNYEDGLRVIEALDRILWL